MIRGLPHPLEGKGVAKKETLAAGEATEGDPLLSSNRGGRIPSAQHFSGSTIRARRSSRSPNTTYLPMEQQQGPSDRYGTYQTSEGHGYQEGASQTSTPIGSTGGAHNQQSLLQFQQQSPSDSVPPSAEREEGLYRTSHQYAQDEEEPPSRGGGGHPPLLEIPEEVYAVRKAALQVLKPLISSWLVVSIGFAVTILLGMARWTQLLPNLPYWFVLLPSWFSHVGILWCHIRSAQALSRFISQANENRQRPDSTDHIDRTEYLPLLQRSLKFGLKTGLLSFCIFLFEVLGYIRIAKGTMPLGVCFIPIWMLVIGGVLDGLVCKTQSFIRLCCWILVLSSMIMATMRIDYGHDELQWHVIAVPIIVVLSFATMALGYIVYGHQVGFYRLTESQLTAGILYSMSAIIAIVLVIVVAEVMPLSRPVEIETRLLVVIMAPLVLCLTGMGAYAVSKDEFGRLLLYGGQSAIHPMRLKWESKGWNSVPTKGVVIIPMFGEVSYRALERQPLDTGIELCSNCCTCYPFEEEEEITVKYPDNAWQDHPYLALHTGNDSAGRAV